MNDRDDWERLLAMAAHKSVDEPFDNEGIAQTLLKRGKKELNIAVIGLQGSGKTKLIKSLCPKGEFVGEKPYSTDKVVCFEAGEKNGISIRLIDTPGLGKLGRKSTTVFQDIVDAVNVPKHYNKGIDLIVFCIKVKGRLEKELRDAFAAMNTHFPDVWSRVIIVLTYADEVQSEGEIASSIRQELKSFGGETVPFLSVENGTSTSHTWIESFWKKCLQRIYKSDGHLQCHVSADIQPVDVRVQGTLAENEQQQQPGCTIADLVLRYDDKGEPTRSKFMRSCENMGLNVTDNKHEHQLEISAKDDVLKEGAEKMRMKLPFSDFNRNDSDWCDRLWNCWCCKCARCEPNVPENLKVNHSFTAIYDRNRKHPDLKFTSSQKAAIVWRLIQNAKYGQEEDQVGVQHLLNEGVFVEAFVPHDPGTDIELSSMTSDHICGIQDISSKSDHEVLCKHYGWSAFWKMCRLCKRQPLSQMRRYFGEKVGFYFAWLGFYTFWLLFASIIGIAVTCVGIYAAVSPSSSILNDACNESLRYDFYMCPVCDERCDFWYLTDSCSLSKLAQVFDNNGTVCMAFLMSVWAVLFLEFWKRQQFSLQFLWDLIDDEGSVECARPQFESKIKKMYEKQGTTRLEGPEGPTDNAPVSDSRCAETSKLLSSEEVTVKSHGGMWRSHGRHVLHNFYYSKPEYVLPESSRWPKFITFLVILATLFFVGVAIVFTVGIYLLRLEIATQVLKNLSAHPSEGDIGTAVVGATIQVFAIFTMSKMFRPFARFLTNKEYHRTDEEYETSVAIKTSMFEFFNYYSSLFYVAFFKANFAGHPGDYHRIGGLRMEECPTYGCMFELTIQFITIIGGMELLNSIFHLFFQPCCKKKFPSKCCLRRCATKKEKEPYDQSMLFSRYMDLVLQYGFITIFIAAFPLAPLFAMIRNCVRIRYDALKLLKEMNRPVPERALDIGVWFNVITVLSQVAVLTNGLLISFTSQFVPELVYHYTEARHTTVSGYLEWSHNSFKVDNLLDGHAFPSFTSQNLQIHKLNEIATDDLLYLPFINCSCLQEKFPELNQHLNCSTSLTGITKVNYQKYIYSNKTVRDSVLKSRDNDPNKSPLKDGAGECFNEACTCRYRGFVMDTFDGATYGTEHVQMNKHWKVLAFKLAVAIIFENIIFLIGVVVSSLVPDVQQSVKNEMLHEKLEAYYFYSRRENETNRRDCMTQEFN